MSFAIDTGDHDENALNFRKVHSVISLRVNDSFDLIIKFWKIA